MKNSIFYICVFLSFISLSNINAQIDIKGENDIQNTLSDKTKKKILKSDKILQKASKYDNLIEQYEKQIENYRNSSGKIKVGKIKKLQNKRNQAILQSKPIFEDGFKTRYKAYSKQIDIISDNTTNEKANELGNKATIKYKEAKKLFSRADNVAKTKDQVEYIVQGRQKYIETITLQINAINNYTNNTMEEVVEEKPDSSTIIKEEIPKETTAVVQDKPVTNNPPVIPAVTATLPTPVPTPVSASVPTVDETVKPEPKPVTIVKEKELGNTFLSVQIMATTRPATSDEIRNVYKGNMKVMEFKSGEYYRYNVGKFRSVDDAKKFISINKIKGFVVAYKDSKRIAVHEALSILATE